MGELTKPACNLLDRKDTTRIKGKGEKGKKERERKQAYQIRQSKRGRCPITKGGRRFTSPGL